MFKTLRIFTLLTQKTPKKQSLRTFLSQAYACNEVWSNRLNNPLIQKVNLDDLYYDLDQRFNKTRTISAVDVDVFATAVRDDVFCDELMDLVHKLRLSADSSNTLPSTPHALIRSLLSANRDEDLLRVLDDRLNYGVFLDNYTANLLLDRFWKNKDFTSGARTAAQIMLQEAFGHPITTNLSLLHLYNYLLNPGKWPEVEVPPEPEEEVKIRVKYLRNPYFDNHFDLRDPLKIVGKTLAMICKDPKDALDSSFKLVGLALYDEEQARSYLENINGSMCKDLLKLLPEENKIKGEASKLGDEPVDVKAVLEKRVQLAERTEAEKDVATQCELFSQWEDLRRTALEEQKERLAKVKRLEDIEVLQKNLKEKEMKLWFFENEEQIELDIDAKRVFYPKKWFGKKKKPRVVDKGYIPPEITPRTTVKS